MSTETSVVAEAQPVEAVVETPVVVTDPVAHFDKMAEAAVIGDTEAYNRLEKEYAESQKQPEPVKEEVKEEVAEPIAQEPEKVEEPETEEVESGETPTETKTPDRFRFKDDADKAVAMLAKAKGISLVAAAKLYDAQETVKEVEKPVEVKVDTTITDMEAEVAGIEAKLDEAGTEEGLFTPQVASLTKQLSKANARLEATRQSAKTLADVKIISDAERFAQTESQLRAQWKTQETAVIKDFPDMANPNSALAIVARGLATQMQDPGHELNATHPQKSRLSDPDAPRFLAEQAAKILKIVPKVAPAKPVAVPAKEVARPAPGSRTTAPPVAEKSVQDIIAEENAKTDLMLSGGFTPSKTGIIIL